ncbi:glutathione S-transferase [Aspergillus leporis]|uniref:Glutathione S-transferase n=1 Tax=Aspergillus leporis TaxID=41062 RepID=A0A5N5XI64_9EURO|nr:glutathione S-transferase [Aspergillus leporis]
MNVFEEQRGLITLYASDGQRKGAIIAIILEELSDGEHIDLSGFHDIVTYLIDRYDTRHEVSYKKGSREDEEVKHWLASISHEPNGTHTEQHRFDLDADDGIPFARKAIHLYLHLEQHLLKSGNKYIVGKKCTLADLVHLPYVAAAGSTGLDLERFPELTLWYDRVFQRPAVQKGYAAVHLKIRG